MSMDVDDRAAVKKYYRQKDLIEAVVETCKYREFAPTYPTGYGSRPDAVNYPQDFKNFVEQGMIACHGSVEKWRNPMLIDQVSDHNNIRTGWDLIIDIDSEVGMDAAKTCAQLILDELETRGVTTSVDIKFSGNRGFHIGIPFDAFPDKVNERSTANLYPSLPQKIVSFLREQIRHDLEEQIPEFESGNVFEIVEPENNWSNRHLFRLPYSINEKSGFASLPLDPEDVPDFEREDAEPGDIQEFRVFMDEVAENEASTLVVDAVDWYQQNRSTTRTSSSTGKEFTREKPVDALPKKYFPPTINNMLNGLSDGRKRAVFVLTTFLRQVGYDWDAIEAELYQWNQRNDEPLEENYIETQLRWHKKQDEDLMPPNFDVTRFYHDIGVYEEDNLTENVANPVTYAFTKAGNDKEQGEDGEEETHECPYCGKAYKTEGKYYREHVQECFDTEERIVNTED